MILGSTSLAVLLRPCGCRYAGVRPGLGKRFLLSCAALGPLGPPPLRDTVLGVHCTSLELGRAVGYDEYPLLNATAHELSCALALLRWQGLAADGLVSG